MRECGWPRERLACSLRIAVKDDSSDSDWQVSLSLARSQEDVVMIALAGLEVAECLTMQRSHKERIAETP